jgi:transposase
VHLANTTATQQYSGLKYTDDNSDARWLADMLRLGILPKGYIYPKAERAVRDLLRKRAHLVRQRTTNILSIENIVQRSEGKQLRGNAVKALKVEQLGEVVAEADVARAIEASLRVCECLDNEIKSLEKLVLSRMKLREEFAVLKSTPGVGDILGLTIMLEAGTPTRFAAVGKYSSYCRCVDSCKLSNRKKKGEGNRKNGNKYLAWAYIEAANFAIRYSPQIHRFYERKKARSKVGVVALKAVAHKLARAHYHMLRNQVPFDVGKAFS